MAVAPNLITIQEFRRHYVTLLSNPPPAALQMPQQVPLSMTLSSTLPLSRCRIPTKVSRATLTDVDARFEFSVPRHRQTNLRSIRYWNGMALPRFFSCCKWQITASSRSWPDGCPRIHTVMTRNIIARRLRDLCNMWTNDCLSVVSPFCYGLASVNSSTTNERW